jgi:hypothetical protein
MEFYQWKTACKVMHVKAIVLFQILYSESSTIEGEKKVFLEANLSPGKLSGGWLTHADEWALCS